jgi:peptidoglycan hydrolase CwlO-like protein
LKNLANADFDGLNPILDSMVALNSGSIKSNQTRQGTANLFNNYLLKVLEDPTRVVALTSYTNNSSANTALANIQNRIKDYQINMLKGLSDSKQSQIDQENTKSEPNTDKITQWQNEITSYQATINQLSTI